MSATVSRRLAYISMALGACVFVTCTSLPSATTKPAATVPATGPAIGRGRGGGGRGGGGAFGRGGGFGRGRGGGATTRPEIPFYDVDLSLDERLDDLIGRLTSDEKVAQLQMDAPGIERLGISSYHWWNEALHGVARNGEATVFPQAIGMAATWNTDLHHEMAQTIAVEARAKHNDAIRQGSHAQYTGLDLWSPNINIFRDPRWGRGQETYGEDPYLTSRFAIAFVTGLQGNDPFYFETIATPKHFAVHSGPEAERHRFDVDPSPVDLYTTYLPAFEAAIREGHAYSVMAAYNSVDGLPCAANPTLLTDILRNRWGFQGYVTSDVDSVKDVYQSHQTADTPELAAAISLKAGCDLNGGTTYRSLTGALQQGLVTEDDINKALRRLFTARFRMGEFDPAPAPGVAVRDPYAATPVTANDNKEHDALALQVARESMVLLKNDNHALPLKKELRSIAVIGPNADSVPALLGNYFGTPSHPVTILQGIRDALPLTTRVLYSEGCPLTTEETPLAEPLPASCLYTDATLKVHGLYGTYSRSYFASDRPTVTRIDAAIDLSFPEQSVRDSLAYSDGFYAQWTGVLVPPDTGDYQIGFTAKDAFRLFLDGKLVVDEFYTGAKRSSGNFIHLEKGKPYNLMVEYNHPQPAAGGGGGGAGAGGGVAGGAGGGRGGRGAAAGGTGGAAGGGRGAAAGATAGAPGVAATLPAVAGAATTEPAEGATGGAPGALPGGFPAAAGGAGARAASAGRGGAGGAGGGGGAGGAAARDTASIQLRWSRPTPDGLASGANGMNLFADSIEAAKSADAVVLVLGITADLEREERPSHIAGFTGGDRTSLDLPSVQERLLEQVTAAAAGKPVVLVLTSGSALSVNWANDHVPAILEAWYPGQHGDAVADILLGNFNPAGRLPVTFYKSADDLPAFTDYGMTGRTYRYFEKPVLYPFGYGLSFANFEYSNLQVSPNATTTGNVTASVSVMNASSVAGEEVVQVYINRKAAPADPARPEAVPNKTLAGFVRVALKPGESKTVDFTITPHQLATIDPMGNRVIHPGAVTLQLGANSAKGLTQEITLTGDAGTPTYGFVAPRVR